MGKIKGRFAPLFEELGNDPRWIMDFSDLDKLMYILILYTIYMTNNRASTDPRYYQRRFNLRARPYQVKRSLAAVQRRFCKLVAGDKTLSLLNYVGYENTLSTFASKKKNKKENKNKKAKAAVDVWQRLKKMPCFKHVHFELENRNMDTWLLSHPGRQKTAGFITNWFKKIPPYTEANQVRDFENGKGPDPKQRHQTQMPQELRDLIRSIGK